MSRFFSLLSIILCLNINVCAQQEVITNDVSHRCSIYDTMELGMFNGSTEGWQPIEGCQLELADNDVLEGSNCLIVKAPGLKANVHKGITKTWENPLDTEGRTLFSVHMQIDSERPGRYNYVVLELRGKGQTRTYQAELMPPLWENLLFDVSDCPYLDTIESISLSLWNQSEEIWQDCSFMIDKMMVGRPLDLQFQIPGTDAAFQSQNGTLVQKNGTLIFNFKGHASLGTEKIANSRNSMYNPPLESYSTFFIVLANQSDATRLRLSYRTTECDWSDAGSKVLEVEPQSGMKAYYINLSDTQNAHGQLTGFRLENEDGTGGSLILDRITLQREEPIQSYAGQLTKCQANQKFVTISGQIDPNLLNKYNTLEIYEAPLYQNEQTLSPGEQSRGAEHYQGEQYETELDAYSLLYKGNAQEKFQLKLNNKSSYGNITLLSSRLLAVVRDAKGGYMKVAPYFWIENWRDFGDNPHKFNLPKRDFNVLDYGARGDAFTDDTEAINNAINACAQAGGGRVVLPGSDDLYGRRYVATHIELKSHVELHLERGAVIWQSGNREDYKYHVYYSHDMDIPNTPWTHCLFVNQPLIQAKSLDHIKITGPGTLRMDDPYSDNPDWGHYARICADCMHILPLGIVGCQDVEITDIDEIHSNNYHTSFQLDDRLYIGNFKMHDVHCVSTDGLSFGNGTKHVLINRAALNSNDDGIVLSCSYGDPRSKICPWRQTGRDVDPTLTDIRVIHSSICSHRHTGGKAVACITWGSTYPDPQKPEIDSIQVSDCVLAGGYSVGTWPDNPFDGKPFTNAETDDFSPVQDFYLHDNVYLDPCDLLCLTPTNFRGDSGIHSVSHIVNGQFQNGHNYWTMEGEADAKSGTAYARHGGRIYQGLYLHSGRYRLVAKTRGNGKLTLWDKDRKELQSSPIKNSNDKEIALEFTVAEDDDFYLGIQGKDVKMTDIQLVPLSVN